MTRKKTIRLGGIVDIVTPTSLTPSERILLDFARDVRKSAYAPYSDFFVGAAIRDTHGRVTKGCNVENANWTGTTHAEQAAIAAMVSRRRQPNEAVPKITHVAVVAAPAGTEPPTEPTKSPFNHTVQDAAAPCGHCLQIIWEFCRGDRNVQLLCLLGTGCVSVLPIGTALSAPFAPLNLGISYS